MYELLNDILDKIQLPLEIDEFKINYRFSSNYGDPFSLFKIKFNNDNICGLIFDALVNNDPCEIIVIKLYCKININENLCPNQYNI